MIVQKEQDQNFISRLHRGRIQIIPWPVINSSGFYALFRHLRNYLDRQPVTHPSGGIFLHNLKTLMAKIKVSGYQLMLLQISSLPQETKFQTSDWGSLDRKCRIYSMKVPSGPNQTFNRKPGHTPCTAAHRAHAGCALSRPHRARYRLVGTTQGDRFQMRLSSLTYCYNDRT